MGLTRDYLRFVPNGVCNIIGSSNGVIKAIDNKICAVTACENVNFFNMRTLEKTHKIGKSERIVTTFETNLNRSFIAIGYDNGEITLQKIFEQHEIANFKGHRTGVNCLNFSNDGFLLASGGKDSVIIVWDIVSETGLFRLNGHKGSITQLKFTVDSKHLISSSKDFQIKFWNIASQSCFYTIAENVSEVYTFGLFNLDRLLIIGSAEVELLVYELTWLDRFVDEKSVDSETKTISNSILPKKFSKVEISNLIGSNFINEENDQANIIVRCKKRGTVLRQSTGRCRQILVSSDNSLLFCVGGDIILDIFRIYNLEESQKRFEKKVKKEKRKRNQDEITGSIESEIAKDVSLLISHIGKFQGNAKIRWVDLCKGSKFVDENTKEYKMYCLLSNNDVQGLLIKVTKSFEVYGESVVSLAQRGHRNVVTTLSFSSNNNVFLSASNESAILWDFNTLLPKNYFFEENMKFITASLFSPSNNEIILCTRDGNIFIFDVADCELISNYKKAHEEAITGIVSLSTTNGFTTVGIDKKVNFWHYETVRDFNRNRLSIKLDKTIVLNDEILCVAISSNQKFIVFGLLDNTARVYYLDSLKFFVALYGHSLPVFCIDISPDSKLVITGSGDKTVKIWGLDFGDCHRSIFAHDNTVTFVKFGPDTEQLLFWSAGKDGKIKQWDATKFNLIQKLDDHTQEICAFCISFNGEILVSASHDKSIRLWEKTDEIINLQEEKEKELEEEYEEKLLDAEDIIPGEALNKEADLAPIKSLDSIKSTESILECINILRNEIFESANNPEHVPHILLSNYKPDCIDYFVIDVLQKIRSSHLEKSLLMVPLNYISDVLNSLSVCVKHNYKIELCCRIILFLTKIHHNQIVNSINLLSIVEKLKLILPNKTLLILDQVGFNLAALTFLQNTLEERHEIKLFKNVTSVENVKKKKKKKL